jgi:O-antigen/teichoic acid export membrane protein
VRLKDLINRLHLGNAVKLSAATALGQMITYAAAPILSRLFTSEDFAQFALFYAWVVPLAVLATFRIEFSIPNTAQDYFAYAHARVALRATFMNSLIFAGIIALLYFIGVPVSTTNMLIPLGMLSVAIPQIFNFLSTRLQYFKLNALYRLTNNIVLNGMSIVLGYMMLGPMGLVLGFLIGQFAASALLYLGIYPYKKADEEFFKEIGPEQKTELSFGDFKNYIFFNTPQGIIETLQLSGTIWLLNVLFGDSNTGYYYLCWRIIQAPITLVSNTVFLVQYNKASALRAEGKSYFTLIKGTAWLLFGLSAIAGLTLFLFGPPLFAWFFGEEWRASGEMARYLAPWFMLNFAVSPFSFTAIIEKKQRTSFIITSIDVIGKIAAIYIGSIYQDIQLAMILFSISSSIILAFTLAWYFKLSR